MAERKYWVALMISLTFWGATASAEAGELASIGGEQGSFAKAECVRHLEQ